MEDEIKRNNKFKDGRIERKAKTERKCENR